MHQDIGAESRGLSVSLTLSLSLSPPLSLSTPMSLLRMHPLRLAVHDGKRERYCNDFDHVHWWVFTLLKLGQGLQ